MYTHIASRLKVCAALAALGCGVLTALPAQAGPDQDAITISRAHVDTAVPHWNAATRTLVVGQTDVYPNNTVLWIGKSQDGRHVYTIPENGSENLAFLGKPGDMFNVAPQNVGGDKSPIFAGYNAGETMDPLHFDDGAYVLDLVDVEGPGFVEVFVHGGAGTVQRRFSSRDAVHRTFYTPRHSHMYTAFSQPGRYKLTYRAAVRDAKNHRLVTSKETAVVWQVGGQDPRQKGIKDYRAAFAKAPARTAEIPSRASEASTIQPTFEIAANTKETNKPVNKGLTNFLFNSGNSADRGTLVLTINGFFLTEVPVEGGIGRASEVLGTEDANIQAIFIPAEDSPSKRWASAPAAFSQKSKAPVKVATGVGELFKETNYAGNKAWRDLETPVSSKDVTVTYTNVAPNDGKKTHVDIVAADPKLRASYKVAFYTGDKPSFTNSCASEEGEMVGRVSFESGFDDCAKNSLMMVTITPHPIMGAAAATLEKKNYSLVEGQPVTFQLKDRVKGAPWRDPSGDSQAIPGSADEDSDSSDSSADDSDSPSEGSDDDGVPGMSDGSGSGGSLGEGSGGKPEGDGNEKPSTEKPGALLTEPVTLTRGHVDLRMVENGGKYAMAISDDTLEHAAKHVMRAMDSVTLAVPHAALVERSPQMSDPSFDFLGPMGSRAYILLQENTGATIWPGFSTEGLDYAKLPGGLDYEVTLEQGPKDARMLFYTTEALAAQANVHIDSSDPVKTRMHTAPGTHEHGNWVFTKPGTYKVKVRALTSEKGARAAGLNTLGMVMRTTAHSAMRSADIAGGAGVAAVDGVSSDAAVEGATAGGVAAGAAATDESARTVDLAAPAILTFSVDPSGNVSPGADAGSSGADADSSGGSHSSADSSAGNGTTPAPSVQPVPDKAGSPVSPASPSSGSQHGPASNSASAAHANAASSTAANSALAANVGEGSEASSGVVGKENSSQSGEAASTSASAASLAYTGASALLLIGGGLFMVAGGVLMLRGRKLAG